MNYGLNEGGHEFTSDYKYKKIGGRHSLQTTDLCQLNLKSRTDQPNQPAFTIMSLFHQTFPQDFSSFFRFIDDYDHHRTGGASRGPVRKFQPRFDVHEETDAYHLDGEFPGIAQQDIDITFTDPQTLIIKGRVERFYSKDSSEHNDSDAEASKEVATKDSAHQRHYWVTERSVGEFHRSFNFPSPVDQEHVKASLKDGVLALVVPKAKPAGAKRIQIE